MKIVIASHNKGKISEYQKLLGDKFEVVSCYQLGFTDGPEETGATFEENAFIKAKAVFDFCHLPSLADDSGLMVDALNGEPGVFSARYAGTHGDDKKNYTLLLENLKGETNRKAHFKTAISLITNEKVYSATGETYGEILDKPVGLGGFGYDPVFYSYDLNKSFGEATSEEKNGVSHRFKAVQNLLKIIEKDADNGLIG